MALMPFAYRRGDSVLHKMNPGLKLLLLFCLCFVAFFEWKYSLISLVLCFVFCVLGFLFAKCTIKSLVILRFVFVIGLLVFLFTVSDFSFSYKYFVSLKKTELIKCFYYVSRFAVTSVASQIVFETTSLIQIQDFFESIENAIAKIVPSLKKMHLALILSLTINFMPLIFSTWAKIKTASAARAGKNNVYSLCLQLSTLLSVMIYQAENKRKAVLNRSDNI